MSEIKFSNSRLILKLVDNMEFPRYHLSKSSIR